MKQYWVRGKNDSKKRNREAAISRTSREGIMGKLAIWSVLIVFNVLAMVFGFGYDSQMVASNVHPLSDVTSHLFFWQVGMWLFSSITLILWVVVTGLWLREQEYQKYSRKSPHSLSPENGKRRHARASRSHNGGHSIAR